MDKPLQTLHKALREQNYDVPENYDDFEYTLSLPGDAGYQNRHSLWQSLKDNNFDVPDNYDDFRETLFNSKETKQQPTVKAKNGYIYSAAGLDSLEQGYKPEYVESKEQPQPTKPIDLSRPQEYEIPKPFAQYQQEMQQQATDPRLSQQWAQQQAEAQEQIVNPTKPFGERIDDIQRANMAEAARQQNRQQFDQSNFEPFFEKHVAGVFGEERQAGEQRAQEEIANIPQDKGGGLLSKAIHAIKSDIATERHTDPEKIANATLQRVQDDDVFGDYVLSRMGINGQSGNDDGDSPQLSEREKEYMKQLFAKETGEVTNQIINRIYDNYKREGAPQSTLDYIAGKAFHENMVASLYDAMVRRVAGSSGMRQQLRAMAYQEYGDQAGWLTQVAGGAAPFAVDMLAGGFALPNAVGQAVVKGGMRLAAKQVAKEMEKRAVARGLEGAALKEAVNGASGIAERYIATNAPIVNIALRTAGGAANFATYDTQSELIRQISDGEFKPFDLMKEAAHGALIGGAMGVTGGLIGRATQGGTLAQKVAGDVAAVASETGIFAAANGIQKAIDQGIDITDVDWADTTGEALGMVVGMKATGAVMHPRQLLNRYRNSKDLGLQLNQHDIDELKAHGYDFDGIFKGLGKFGEIAPQEPQTVKRSATEYTANPDGTGRKRNTTVEEVTVDTEAYDKIMSNPELSSSVKRKLAYIVTGKVLSLEPTFGATLDVDDNGKATITTLNAYGNIIDTKEYDNADEARKDYQALQEVARTNTIGGLERIADKAGFPDVLDEAKGRTKEETGIDVDDTEQLSSVSEEKANEVLDTYQKNLQEAYMQRFNGKMEQIDAMGKARAEEGPQEAIDRTERRQEAYDRGATVAEDESLVPQLSYESKLAEARIMQMMPDGEQSGTIRSQVMQAMQSGDVEGAEAILQRNAPYLTPQQREAMEQWMDTFEIDNGVTDAVNNMIAQYEEEQREELSAISDEQGNITKLQLKDGSIAYYKSGDMNRPMSNVFVTTEDGRTIQISSNDIVSAEPTVSAEDMLADNVQQYDQWIKSHYSELATGQWVNDGQEADISMGGQIFHVVKLGYDEAGNNIFQMPDGSRMAMSIEQTAEAIAAADDIKIQQQLAQEMQEENQRKQAERFGKGIVGYNEGTPDLMAKNTKPEVAAEYLLSQTDEQGQPIDRKVVLDGIQKNVDDLNIAKQQALQALQTANNNLVMADEGEVDALRQQAEQLEAQVADLNAQYRKWGEIRQAMMNDEERQAYEKDRIKAINKAREQSQKDVQPSAGTVTIPTVKELMEQYAERSDAEAFVEEQRKQLSQLYQQDLYPQYDDIQKQLEEYRHGLTDLTPNEIKALTDQQAMLSGEISRAVEAANQWKQLVPQLSRSYSARESQNMTPHERAMNALAKETNKQKKVELAKKAFADDPMALNVLDNMEPQDVNEWIAANLGAGSMNWEGLQRGEHYVRGLRDEMGKDKTRGIGAGYDTNAFNTFLAPEGQGKGIEEVVHDIAESSPYDTQEVKNALLSMLQQATKPTDISHYIENNRIAQAEDIYEKNLEHERELEEEAKRQAEDDAIREMTGMEPEEYDAFMADLEQRLAEQEGYQNSEEYFKQIEEYDRRNEGNAGGSQAESPVVVQGQEVKQAGAEAEGQGGTGEAVEQLKKVNKDIDALCKKYNSLAPVETFDSQNLTDEQIQDIAGQQLTPEEIEEGRELLRNAKTPSFYSPFSKKIYIFADKYNPEETEEWFFHENVHRGLDQYYGDNPMEVAEAFWNTESPTKPEATAKHKEAIQRVYADKDEAIQHEEYLVHMLGHYMTTGKVDRLLERMSPEHQEIIKNILKNVKYDTTKESATRNPEEAVQLEGSNEEDALQQKGGDERGRVGDTTKGEDLMHVPFADRLQAAKGETNVNPTEEQKKAGNYKMGHVRFGGYRMTIENPKGSTRSGVDANGKPWSIEMKDTYGYIREKYGTDKDHLDFFINDDADLDNWNGRVYVVDQKNEDGTFDEHKVMYGYPTFAEAKKAYLRNYEDGWWEKHVMSMTGVRKEKFDKWLESSDYKTKPFAEYSVVQESNPVSSNVDQLMADIEDRKKVPGVAEEEPKVTVKGVLNEVDLKRKKPDDLKQLRKKENQDRAMAKMILGTTDAIKGTDKERTLQEKIIRAEANMATIDKVLAEKQADAKKRYEQQEIGFAMVDQLENMGFEVSTDTKENRKVLKQAEKDNSEAGKLHHFRTSDGKIYGFSYKGKIYLDPTKIDAELPMHEYGHPWCEAFRKLNPDGWKNIVGLMKADKDTWEFIKSLNPDLESEDDISEEMITKCSGQRGAEYARKEFERMNSKGNWGNIWKNISKAIQDFWKAVGDFLHIKYKSAEQVYDQVIRDFANKVNPRMRVKQWLAERDKTYVDAVKKGDMKQAKELFDAALRENIGNGITPYIAVEGYRKMRTLAHAIKERDPKVVEKVADMMAPLIPKDAVLVPAPSHTGKATDMLDLANAISERTGAPVADVLTSGERGSQYEAKYAGKPISSSEMGITMTGELPDGKMPVVIDNVVDTGNTAEACVQALGKGIVASLADSVEQRKHVASLKSAEPVVTDKYGHVVPLSSRFDFMIEEGNLFSNEDFEEPEANTVQLPRLNSHGLNLNSTLGNRLTELKKQAGENGLVGYTTDDAYVFVGDSTKAVAKYNKYNGVAKGVRDGMQTISIPASMFDRVSPQLVKAGYKMAFLENPNDDEYMTSKPNRGMSGTVANKAGESENYNYQVGDKFDIIDDNGERLTTTVVNVTPEGEIVIDVDNYGVMPPVDADIIDEYRRRAEAPKDAETLLNEVKRRKDVATDKKEAEDAVNKYLSRKPKNEEEQVKQRATKAVLKAMEKAGVPYKVVSKEEEKQMLQIFSMMNQEPIKELARKLRNSVGDSHGKSAKYIIYNMADPFGVPMYFEKLSTAKYALKGLKQMAPEATWQILDIGYPDEAVEEPGVARKAADMNVGDLQADIEALHGSGYTFTKFDHSNMGKGAGSQVFGWGTYLTSGKKIAEDYANTVAKRKYNDETPGYNGKEVLYKGEKINLDQSKLDPLRLAYDTLNSEGTIKKAVTFVERLMDYAEEQDMKDTWQEVLNILKNSKKSDFKVRNADLTDKRFIYKVDIPEDTGDNYLDWMTTIKKPLRRKIADAVRQLDGEPKQSFIYTNYKNGWQSLADMIEREQWAYKEIHDRILMAFGGRVKDAEKVSKLMNSLGFVGVKYPAGTIWGGGDGATNYVIFNEDDAKIVQTISFMWGDEHEPHPIFVSNALNAVENIKQEKATPEQWLAMIQKNGGLKAGEDKWLGLSDWLKEQKGSVTKQDVLDYIRQNQIQVEEVPYQEYVDVNDSPKMQQFQKEYQQLTDKLNNERNAVNDEMERFNQKMYEKYGNGWANDLSQLNDEDRKRYNGITNRYNFLNDNDIEELAFADMVEKYGDDFSMAFEVNYGNGKLEPQMDMYGDDISDAAKSFLELTVQPINSTRLSYTTEGLNNKREIALTVPTIEPWNVDDQIHFGDADNGRAVAWIRFGDTEIHDPVIRKALDSASEELYDYLDRMSEKYHTNPDNPEDMEEKRTPEEKEEHKRIMDNIRKYDEADEANTKKVLVIDEIQSKRHQEGREKGYRGDALSKNKEADEMRKRHQELVAKRNELIDRDMKRRDAIRLSPEGQALIGEDGYIKDGKVQEYQSLFDNDQELKNIEEEKAPITIELLQLENKMRELNGWSHALVPDAPFEKNWHELAMKRMLRYAAENGYDKIAWTTGEQQAERYSLGNVVYQITSTPYEAQSPSESDGHDLLVNMRDGTRYEMFVQPDGTLNSNQDMFDGKNVMEVFGKELGSKIMASKEEQTISGDGLRVGAEGMRGFYDEMLVRFMNKYGKKWGVKVDKTELPEIKQTMWSIDVTPEMKESVMQGQPMFQKEGKKLLGWSDGKQVYLTKDGLNPNTPLHETTHLWDNWCMKEHPDLWKKLVEAMKQTAMWEEISKNPNYRNIWNDENRMASEVHARLSGAAGEDEFMKAAFKKDTPQSIINQVKSALKKFWDAVLRLFGKHSKTVGSDWDDLRAIIRMPIRDLVNQDFEKVMKVAEPYADAEGAVAQAMKDEIIERTLMGVHNISEDKLRKAIKQGGLANPSLAVIDTKGGYVHTDYGAISLIPKASLIDAKTGRNAGTFTADAWTPSYPPVERVMSNKGWDKFFADLKDIRKVDSEVASKLRVYMESYLDNREPDAMYWWYLHDRGLNPEIAKHTSPYNKELSDRIAELTGGNERATVLDLSEDAVKEIATLYHDYKKSQGEELKPLEERIAYTKQRINPDDPNKMRQLRLQGIVNDLEKYGEIKSNLDNFISSVNFATQRQGETDDYTTFLNARKTVENEDRKADYQAWLEELNNRYGIEEKIFDGWTPSGNKKYIPNTLENVSKYMKKQGLNGATNWSSIGNWIAKVANKEKTLEGIRSKRRNLGTPEAEHDAFHEKWSNIMHGIADKLGNGDMWTGEQRMSDILEHKDFAGYTKREYGITLSKEDIEAINTFIKEVRNNFPTGYFETKFERPVKLNEFEIAVVPEGTSEDVIKALKDAGLDVRTYKKGDEGDKEDEARRRAVMNAVTPRKDILFHIEDDPETVKKLDKEPKEVGYRNVVVNEDGTLGSPMANRLGKKGEERKATTPFEYGKWERSDEHPELANENGKIDLIKPDGKSVGGVDYNPYIHIRPNKVNKQFKQAWERPNLVYVETEYPTSELNGEYHAEKAALPTGKHPWGGGELILSRWDKPLRMVPWEEVADDWVKEFNGTEGIHFDIIPPKLLPILAERGMTILPPHKGMGKDCFEAYEQWKDENMYRRAADTADLRFNRELDAFKDKQHQGLLHLGKPGAILRLAGVDAQEMTLSPSVLHKHLKKHGLTTDDLKGLAGAVQKPILVYKHGEKYPNLVVVTEMDVKDGKLSITLELDNAGHVVEISNIKSIHSKDATTEIDRLYELGEETLKNSLRWVDKEKVSDWLLRHPYEDERTESNPKLNSVAKVINIFENPKLSEENLRNIYVENVDAAEQTAEMLGGQKIVFEAEAPEEGTLGWYDPNDNTVHVVLPEQADVAETVRTVFHEKLGHEGLVALLGSQEAVNKFGSFVFHSAKNDVRKRIMDKAEEIDPEWRDGARYSKAAQEVLAEIAEEGRKTEDEFDLWTKVKHYLIRFLNKIGLRVRGLLNDKDLAYYIVKTGKALQHNISPDLSKQATEQDILRSRGGKPRQRRGESMAQYFQRLREWEKWKLARQTALDNGDPEPKESQFQERAETKYREDMAEWRRENGLPEGASSEAGTFPIRRDGESPQEFAIRVQEYEARRDLLATAPQYMDYMRKANEDYRRAYTEWRERYDLEEQMSVDQRLYEGDVPVEPTFTDADEEVHAAAERDLADEAGFEIDERGAKRMAKLAVIERRKDFESANAEDAIWVYDFMKMTDSVADEIKQRTGQDVTGKEIREALPFLIEADRRRENMEAEKEEAVQVINMSRAIQQAHSFMDFRNLEQIGEEVNALQQAWEYQENHPSGDAQQAYREAAARLADKLNELNKDYAGYNKLFADDIMQIRSLLVHASVAGGGEVMPPSAQRFADMPEMKPLMEHIKAWYDEFFQLLEDTGLRGDAGYIEDGYVNHVWDKEKSDPKAWEQYIENRQRTKSPNMRHREIDTYMDGIKIGLVPKYTDIADMIAHYSRQNNEAVANRRFLDALKFVYVQEMNSEGEVTAVLPLLMVDKPDGLLRDRYAQYYVPGVGDVYVMKHIKNRFANVFGTMRTQDVNKWVSDFGKGYDIVSATAKKIQLALSGFHALALFEVDVAQNNPAVALKHLLKYIIADGLKKDNKYPWGFSETKPAYAHPEDFQLAAKHLVQLGATEDYAAADVNAITANIREYFKALQKYDNVFAKAAGVVGSPAAIFMDWINKGFDTVLWNYLHDGLKLCAFKELAKQIDRRVAKEGLDEKMREQLLDEAGQYVNDMFGGQYWELINVSPADLKLMRRFLLSPDWIISTQRHFFANFGFGSVYSDGGFREYIKYNTDNIQRLLGKDIPHDELRRLRSKNAKYCYLIGALVWWNIFYNAINALMRWLDEKDEKKKAEEMRKTNPEYKSPYELVYPNGMKWYDYTMWGNAIGQQTHLFTGRYADGTETYVRWGKQFREFPELFMGRYGIEFPAPLIERIKAKANPNIGTVIDFFGAQNIGGFNGSYENKELREKYGKTIATLSSTSRHFIPFGMPTQTEKEYKWLDFFMPSSKGFSRWKAKDYFETFIMDGDWNGIDATYNACVMNGIDAEKALDAAIASIKATQKKELAGDVTDLTTAAQKFDEATTPEKRAVLLNKLKKHLKDTDYKVMTKQDARDKVQAFLDGDAANENARYLMLVNSEDVIAEEHLKDLGRKAKQYIKKVNDAPDNEQEALENRYAVWYDINDIVNEATKDIREMKKLLGGMDDKQLIKDIRQTIRDAQKEIDELEAPK